MAKAVVIANRPVLVKTYLAKRALDIGEAKRGYDELVPEAVTWFRVMNMVNCGFLKEVEIPEDDYIKAVQKFCPDLAEELAPLVDIPVARLKGKK